MRTFILPRHRINFVTLHWTWATSTFFSASSHTSFLQASALPHPTPPTSPPYSCLSVCLCLMCTSWQIHTSLHNWTNLRMHTHLHILLYYSKIGYLLIIHLSRFVHKFNKSSTHSTIHLMRLFTIFTFIYSIPPGWKTKWWAGNQEELSTCIMTLLRQKTAV